jgi:hypothetical protein
VPAADDLELDLLGLLTADAESFAVQRADLIRNCGYPPESHVDHVLRALSACSQWLGEAGACRRPADADPDCVSGWEEWERREAERRGGA